MTNQRKNIKDKSEKKYQEKNRRKKLLRDSRDDDWGCFMIERVLDAVLPHDGVMFG